VHASLWPSRALRLIEEIEGTHDVAAIPALAEVALDCHGRVAARAAGAVRVLLGDVPDSELARLDRKIRGSYVLAPTGIEQVLLDRVTELGPDAWAIFAVLCSYYDGHVRERAARHLSHERSGVELRFLLLRARDHVEQVRAVAYDAIRARLVPAHAARLASHAGLVVDLERQTRFDHSALVADIAALLGGPEGEGAVNDGLRASDFRLRRVWYRVALGSAWAARSLAFGFDDEDPVIRIRCAERALRETSNDVFRAAVDRMLSDPYMPVRRRGLRAVVRRLPDRAPAVLRAALLDRSGSIRGEARWHLSKDPAFNAAAFYRDALARQDLAIRATALHGLADVGVAGDARAVEAFLDDPRPSVRAAALRAFARLAPQPVEKLLAALGDPSARVSRLAVRLLEPHREILDLPRLVAMLGRSPFRHVRACVFRVIDSMPRWEGGAPILLACGSADEALAAMARDALDRWLQRYNHSFDRPSAAQLKDFRAALDRARLDPRTRHELEHIARGWAASLGS